MLRKSPRATQVLLTVALLIGVGVECGQAVGQRIVNEINLITAGANYGWPLATYGREYDGNPVGKGLTHAAGTVQPVYYYDPDIVPSGMFLNGIELPGLTSTRSPETTVSPGRSRCGARM